jgi:hypothetical protein
MTSLMPVSPLAVSSPNGSSQLGQFDDMNWGLGGKLSMGGGQSGLHAAEPTP